MRASQPQVLGRLLGKISRTCAFDQRTSRCLPKNCSFTTSHSMLQVSLAACGTSILMGQLRPIVAAQEEARGIIQAAFYQAG